MDEKKKICIYKQTLDAGTLWARVHCVSHSCNGLTLLATVTCVFFFSIELWLAAVTAVRLTNTMKKKKKRSNNKQNK